MTSPAFKIFQSGRSTPNFCAEKKLLLFNPLGPDPVAYHCAQDATGSLKLSVYDPQTLLKKL